VVTTFEVAIVSLSNDFPMLSCPIHKGNNRILYSPVVKQAEVQSLSRLHRYARIAIILGVFHKMVHIVAIF
jgi:hypothetical protein